MMLAPHYRHYDLPWSSTEEVERRFRVTLRNILVIFAIAGVLIPFLPAPRRLSTPPALPDRVVKMAIERRLPPPPPSKEEEKPKAEEKPEKIEAPPDEKPKLSAPKEVARKQAEQAAKVFDAFAGLRDAAVIDKARQNSALSQTAVERTRQDGAIPLAAASVGSGGINTAAVARGYGGGSGALTGRETARVSSALAGEENRGEARRAAAGLKSTRSPEDIALTFDRNKGAIFSIYNRALRDNPGLKGKVVLEITIAPTGEVVECRILSSELGDPELERKLAARVKSFRFEARDVQTVTVTKPIDFFPGG